MKGEGTVDQNTVTKWFKKFCSDYKRMDNQTRSDGSNIMDSEVVLLTEMNLVSSILRISEEPVSHSPVRLVLQVCGCKKNKIDKI